MSTKIEKTAKRAKVEGVKRRRVDYSNLWGVVQNLAIMCLDEEEGAVVNDVKGIWVRFGATIDWAINDDEGLEPPDSENVHIKEQALFLRIENIEMAGDITMILVGITKEDDEIRFQVKFTDSALTEVDEWSYRITTRDYCVQFESVGTSHKLFEKGKEEKTCGDVNYAVIRLAILEDDEVPSQN